MFEPRKLTVHYWIKPEGHDPIEFDIRLSESGLLEDTLACRPEWTRIRNDQCIGCASCQDHCVAALSIAPVIDAFLAMKSFVMAQARVTIDGRITEFHGPVSVAVSSLMGLCLAASGCQATAPFRVMAMYHQPFATLEVTVIRAAGFSLLRRWANSCLNEGNPFDELIEAWSRLGDLNHSISQRLARHCSSDATLNGLVNLDMFAKGGLLGLETALETLRPVLTTRQY